MSPAVIVYAVADDALAPDFPLGVELEVFILREDAERFIESSRRRAGARLALRIEERELEPREGREEAPSTEPLRAVHSITCSCQRLRVGAPRPQDVRRLFLEPGANSRKRERRRDRAREYEESVPEAMTPPPTHPTASIVEVVEQRAEVLSKLLVSSQTCGDAACLDVFLEPLARLGSVVECGTEVSA
jgi:hypothetical protein